MAIVKPVHLLVEVFVLCCFISNPVVGEEDIRSQQQAYLCEC